MDLFLIRLLLSFVVGGIWVTLITEATLKYGPRIGGLLGGFPSTVAFSLIFIGWTQSVASAAEATTTLPLALSFTATTPLVYAFLARRGNFGTALAGALAFWGGASILLSVFTLTIGLAYTLSLVGFYVISGLAYYLLARGQEPLAGNKGLRLSGFQWVWRFVLAGGIVVGAVLLSVTLGPLVGGIFASFPAIITSTIYIVRSVQGIEASRGIAVPMMVATVVTIVPYTVIVRYSYPVVGVLFGTLAGYAVAIPLSLIAYVIIGRLGREQKV